MNSSQNENIVRGNASVVYNTIIYCNCTSELRKNILRCIFLLFLEVMLNIYYLSVTCLFNACTVADVLVCRFGDPLWCIVTVSYKGPGIDKITQTYTEDFVCEVPEQDMTLTSAKSCEGSIEPQEDIETDEQLSDEDFSQVEIEADESIVVTDDDRTLVADESRTSVSDEYSCASPLSTSTSDSDFVVLTISNALKFSATDRNGDDGKGKEQ